MSMCIRIEKAIPDQAFTALACPRFLQGMSAFRIMAGLTIVYQYLINYAQRRFLWGPDGVYPLVAGWHSGVPILSWSRSLVYFEVVYHAGLIVALLWLLGWRTRYTTPANMLIWRALADRTPILGDGGDNLTALLLVYACFANVSEHWSLDAISRRPTLTKLWLRHAAGLIHNAAVVAIAAQLCMLYAVAGLTKVQGETWRDGTALYFAFRTAEYSWPGVSERIYTQPIIVTILSYGTVAFQISFPFCLILNSTARRAALAVALTFHLGIACMMGLTTFALFMMAADVIFLTDTEYGHVRSRFKTAALWGAARLKGIRSTRSHEKTEN